MNAIREVGWWRWPLWSWRNLAVTVIGAALLVAGVGRLSEGGGSESVAAEPAAIETADTASDRLVPIPFASRLRPPCRHRAPPPSLRSRRRRSQSPSFGSGHDPMPRMRSGRRAAKPCRRHASRRRWMPRPQPPCRHPELTGRPRSSAGAMAQHRYGCQPTAERCTSLCSRRRPDGASTASSRRSSPSSHRRRGADRGSGDRACGCRTQEASLAGLTTCACRRSAGASRRRLGDGGLHIGALRRRR